MTTHHLKCVQPWFDDICDGRKTADIRSEADRSFAVEDEIVLHEWDADTGYSGRQVAARITHILRDTEFKGLAFAYAMLSFIKVGADL